MKKFNIRTCDFRGLATHIITKELLNEDLDEQQWWITTVMNNQEMICMRDS